MKRVFIEGAILAAFAFGLPACERDAISAERHSTIANGRDAASRSASFADIRDSGPREIAPVAPFQVPTGMGGSGGTFGPGGTGGTGGTGGSGGTGGTGGTFGTGGTGGTFGTGGTGGMNTGGTLR
jgi:hypothetical protein